MASAGSRRGDVLKALMAQVVSWNKVVEKQKMWRARQAELGNRKNLPDGGQGEEESSTTSRQRRRRPQYLKEDGDHDDIDDIERFREHGADGSAARRRSQLTKRRRRETETEGGKHISRGRRSRRHRRRRRSGSLSDREFSPSSPLTSDFYDDSDSEDRRRRRGRSSLDDGGTRRRRTRIRQQLQRRRRSRRDESASPSPHSTRRHHRRRRSYSSSLPRWAREAVEKKRRGVDTCRRLRRGGRSVDEVNDDAGGGGGGGGANDWHPRRVVERGTRREHRAVDPLGRGVWGDNVLKVAQSSRGHADGNVVSDNELVSIFDDDEGDGNLFSVDDDDDDDHVGQNKQKENNGAAGPLIGVTDKLAPRGDKGLHVEEREEGGEEEAAVVEILREVDDDFVVDVDDKVDDDDEKHLLGGSLGVVVAGRNDDGKMIGDDDDDDDDFVEEDGCGRRAGQQSSSASALLNDDDTHGVKKGSDCRGGRRGRGTLSSATAVRGVCEDCGSERVRVILSDSKVVFGGKDKDNDDGGGDKRSHGDVVRGGEVDVALPLPVVRDDSNVDVDDAGKLTQEGVGSVKESKVVAASCQRMHDDRGMEVDADDDDEVSIGGSAAQATEDNTRKKKRGRDADAVGHKEPEVTSMDDLTAGGLSSASMLIATQHPQQLQRHDDDDDDVAGNRRHGLLDNSEANERKSEKDELATAAPGETLQSLVVEVEKGGAVTGGSFVAPPPAKAPTGGENGGSDITIHQMASLGNDKEEKCNSIGPSSSSLSSEVSKRTPDLSIINRPPPSVEDGEVDLPDNEHGDDNLDNDKRSEHDAEVISDGQTVEATTEASLVPREVPIQPRDGDHHHHDRRRQDDKDNNDDDIDRQYLSGDRCRERRYRSAAEHDTSESVGRDASGDGSDHDDPRRSPRRRRRRQGRDDDDRGEKAQGGSDKRSRFYRDTNRAYDHKRSVSSTLQGRPSDDRYGDTSRHDGDYHLARSGGNFQTESGGRFPERRRGLHCDRDDKDEDVRMVYHRAAPREEGSGRKRHLPSPPSSSSRRRREHRGRTTTTNFDDVSHLDDEEEGEEDEVKRMAIDAENFAMRDIWEDERARNAALKEHAKLSSFKDAMDGSWKQDRFYSHILNQPAPFVDVNEVLMKSQVSGMMNSSTSPATATAAAMKRSKFVFDEDDDVDAARFSHSKDEALLLKDRLRFETTTRQRGRRRRRERSHSRSSSSSSRSVLSRSPMVVKKRERRRSSS